MFMSEKEFKELVKKQPHLLKSQIDIKNTNKYKNVKLYEYKNGFATTEKSFQGDKPVFVYDSIKEYNRWIELKTLERAGEISNLKRQVSLLIQEDFEYSGNSQKEKIQKITYKADFYYIQDGIVCVEDVKPYDTKTEKYRLTKDFQLKWKLLKFKYPDYKFIVY